MSPIPWDFALSAVPGFHHTIFAPYFVTGAIYSGTAGIVNSTIKRQHSRAMNMRYFWIMCQEPQKILKVRYHPGQEILGDYQTKPHNGASHQRARPFYLHMKNSPRYLPRAMRPSVRRGCVGKLGDPYTRSNPLPNIPSIIRTPVALGAPAVPTRARRPAVAAHARASPIR